VRERGQAAAAAAEPAIGARSSRGDGGLSAVADRALLRSISWYGTTRTAEYSMEYSTVPYVQSYYTVGIPTYSPYAHTGNLRSHIRLNFRPHRESAVYFRLKGRYVLTAKMGGRTVLVGPIPAVCSKIWSGITQQLPAD
jgi:hypothetical protein